MCNCWESDCLFVVSCVGFAQVVCIYKCQVASMQSIFTGYFTKLPCHIVADGSCPLYLHTMAYLSA